MLFRLATTDLENLCREAAMLALREGVDKPDARVAQRHLLAALALTSPSLTEQDMLRYSACSFDARHST